MKEKILIYDRKCYKEIQIDFKTFHFFLYLYLELLVPLLY